MVAKAGRACSVDKARYIGSSPDTSFYEVACHEGAGYILQVPKAPDSPPVASMCLLYGDASNVKCELTPPAQQMAVIDQLAAASGKACTVKDRRYVGSSADHIDYFEVACADGKGYMLEVASWSTPRSAAPGSRART